jgi:hypothetical protein
MLSGAPAFYFPSLDDLAGGMPLLRKSRRLTVRYTSRSVEMPGSVPLNRRFDTLRRELFPAEQARIGGRAWREWEVRPAWCETSVRSALRWSRRLRTCRWRPTSTSVPIRRWKVLARACWWQRLSDKGRYVSISGQRTGRGREARPGLHRHDPAPDPARAGHCPDHLEGRPPDGLALPTLLEPFPAEWEQQRSALLNADSSQA